MSSLRLLLNLIVCGMALAVGSVCEARSARWILQRQDAPQPQEFEGRIGLRTVTYGPGADLFHFATSERGEFDAHRRGYVFDPNTGRITELPNACDGAALLIDDRIRAALSEPIYSPNVFQNPHGGPFWPEMARVRFWGNGRISYTCILGYWLRARPESNGGWALFQYHLLAETRLPGIPGPPARLVRIVTPQSGGGGVADITSDELYIASRRIVIPAESRPRPQEFVIADVRERARDDLHWAEPAIVENLPCPAPQDVPGGDCELVGYGLTHTGELFTSVQRPAMLQGPRGTSRYQDMRTVSYALLRATPDRRLRATASIAAPGHQIVGIYAGRQGWFAFSDTDAALLSSPEFVDHAAQFWRPQQGRRITVRARKSGAFANFHPEWASVDSTGHYGVVLAFMRLRGRRANVLAIFDLEGRAAERTLTYEDALLTRRLALETAGIGVSDAGHVFAFLPRRIEYLGTLSR